MGGTISSASQQTAGILLLTIVAVQFGGLFLLRIVGGRKSATRFQLGFFRAGHAHAGVLIILSLVCQLYADAADLSGVHDGLARRAVPLAAILMPAGFFLSAVGHDRTEPNRFVVLVYIGAVSLAAGVVALGVALL